MPAPISLSPSQLIVVTGACGFIGSRLICKLNSLGFSNIIAVDSFNNDLKNSYLLHCSIAKKIDKDVFLQWFVDNNTSNVCYVVHLGAISSTTETNVSLLKKYNTLYSISLWEKCCEYSIPAIFASSAATYGNGNFGYVDNETIIPSLSPLNLYGISKNEFDKWAILQTNCPPKWQNLKFFNVYGYNEFHKKAMASVVFHSYHQIKKEKIVKLFKSYNHLFADGQQKRDFVFVDDVLNVILWLMNNNIKNGIYNVGTGKARSFYDLATAVFSALSLPPSIDFVDMPPDIINKYQYFTEADMSKLISAGYPYAFTELEEGVKQYVDFLTSYE